MFRYTEPLQFLETKSAAAANFNLKYNAGFVITFQSLFAIAYQVSL